MSRDISIYKTNPDTSKISLPLLFVNPHLGYPLDKILRYIHTSPDIVLQPEIFPYGIKEYYWIHEGSPGKATWYALGSLQGGLYFFYTAYTHTTFDKDGHMDLWVSYRFDDLIQYSMDTFIYTIYIKDIQNITSNKLTSDLVNI
jgi:hypothetical protein